MKPSFFMGAALLGFIVFSADSALGQGPDGTRDKIKQLESQMARLERGRQSDLSWISQHVATLQALSDSMGRPGVDGEIETRLKRLEEELKNLKVATSSDRSIEVIDSLSAALALLSSDRRDTQNHRSPLLVDSLSLELGSLMERMSALLIREEERAEVAPSLQVQPTQLPVTFTGQIRPRFESRGFGSEAKPDDWFTSMRVRGTLSADLDDGVSVVVQFQDVRLWGEETNTLGDFRADNLDLHQGYLQVTQIGGRSLSARVGRQVVAFGGQRLVGAVEWAQQGRAFDGGRISIGSDGPRMEVIGIRISESSAPSVTTDASLFGAYATVPKIGSGDLDVYALHNRASGDATTTQTTVGGRWYGHRKAVTFRLESSFQTGTRTGVGVSAYMIGARVGRSIFGGRGTVTAWYDFLSGDDPSDEKTQAFSTLFATNHKFYGFADLFLNIPVQTGGHGLQDFALKFSAKTSDRTKVGLDLHSFYAARVGVLSTGHFADEADLTLSFKFSKQLSIVGGLSRVVPRDGLKEIGRSSVNKTFTFLMTNVVF
jgi:Alginate export